MVLWVLSFSAMAQSPHGEDFNINCDVCHSSVSWDITDHSAFNHDSTNFMLTGQHQQTECRLCHTSLEFKKAETDCNACHADIHNHTVGQDCGQCHNTSSWIVTNIMEVHQTTRFPLTGAHAVADCYDCHKSASLLRFDPMGVDCYDCHRPDYTATQNPNHLAAGFSTVCTDCHNMNATDWGSQGFNHDFFPLTQGHNIQDCAQCHQNGDYTNTSAECAACHTEDYNGTTNPSHIAGDFPMQCEECHTTHPGWSPADFKSHDTNWFPIYSGTHNGTWQDCSECHTQPGNYTLFSCVACHEHNKADTDEEHKGVSGYSYNSSSCYACHPNGRSDGAFDHNLTNFPLTGAHRNAECLQCHAAGYEGTSMECNSCHNADYVASQDPPHLSLAFPTECAECHTTNPGWEPATFAIHDNYYPLRGAHATVASDCKLCHEKGYINTPSECFGCHAEDYAATTNPSHADAKFSTECQTCHTESGWSPSSFNHDDYYPLRGAHATIASDCKQCHAAGYTNTPSECIGCHAADFNGTTNPAHATAKFPTDCEMCHNLNAWTPSSFNHDGQYFPIYSGTHRGEWTTCTECHTNPSNFGTFSCFTCHEHNKTSMDSKHREVRNYVYNSINCFSCHPRGRN